MRGQLDRKRLKIEKGVRHVVHDVFDAIGESALRVEHMPGLDDDGVQEVISRLRID